MVQKLYPHEFLIKRVSVSPACGLDPSTDGFAVLQKPLADLVSYPDALYLFLKHAADEEILAMFFFTEEEGWLKGRVSQLLQCTERLPVIKLPSSQLGLLGEEAKECLQCTIDKVSAELAATRTDPDLPGTNTPFAAAKSLLIAGSLAPVADALNKMDIRRGTE